MVEENEKGEELVVTRSEIMRGRKPKYNFTDNERRIMDRLIVQKKELNKGILAGLAGAIEYVRRRNSIIAVVPTKMGVLVGSAKRNPRDEFNLEAGMNIAFKRAILHDPEVEYIVEA